MTRTTAGEDRVLATRTPRCVVAGRRRRLAVLTLTSLAAVSGCTSGDPEPVVVVPPTATTPSASAASPAGPTSESVVTPEDQAAADAEAAYRRFEVESLRFTATALRERLGGDIGVGAELQAVLSDVAVSDMFTALYQSPGLILAQYPDSVDIVGEPEVVDVVVDTVELYDPPRSVSDVDHTRDGVMGSVVLRACSDITSVQVLDAAGQRLNPGGDTPSILTETVVMSLQPHPDTGVTAWYAATRTNTEGTTCNL